MAKAKDFLRALQAAEHVGAESVDEYWRRQRDAWVADLGELRRSMVQWLGPVCEAQRARWREQDFTLMEPDTGEYSAPGLEIESPWLASRASWSSALAACGSSVSCRPAAPGS